MKFHHFSVLTYFLLEKNMLKIYWKLIKKHKKSVVKRTHSFHLYNYNKPRAPANTEFGLRGYFRSNKFAIWLNSKWYLQNESAIHLWFRMLWLWHMVFSLFPLYLKQDIIVYRCSKSRTKCEPWSAWYQSRQWQQQLQIHILIISTLPFKSCSWQIPVLLE